MSTLKEQLDDLQPPKQAWVWTTETMKNCMLGKHEPKILGFFEGVPMLKDGPWPGYRDCRHCNCVFPEKP